MKILAVSALLCAIMALTAADAVEMEELEDEEAPAAEELNVEKRTQCTQGWTWIGKRTFIFVSKLMTWKDAEKNCVALGGHLASVHSQDEYGQIQNLLSQQTNKNPQAWIGGCDTKEEGVWSWSDGTSFNFKKWCQGEPNNGFGTNQDCAQMNYSGKKCWDDLWCSHLRPSVCVRK